MSQKFSVGGFKWAEHTSEFSKDFIENYNQDGYEVCFLAVQFPKKLLDLHNNLSFLPERMNIEKVEKLVTNLYDEKEYVIHIGNLKQALNHGLVMKKVHPLICTQSCIWIRPFI